MKFLRLQSFSAAFWMTQAVVLAACIFGLAALAMQQRALQWVVHTREVREQLERVSALLTSAETAQRIYLLRRGARSVEGLREAVDALPAELAALESLIADNAAQRQALLALRRDVDARLAQLMAVTKESDDAPAAVSESGYQLMLAIRRDVRGMLDAESALLAVRERRAADYRALGWGAIATLGVLAIALLWFLRHAAARELHHQGRHRQILESLPQLVWTCTSEGKADFLSRQWLEYTGATLASQLGYGWLEHVHPDDRGSLLEKWRQAVARGGAFDTQARISAADGSWRWFKQRAVPLVRADGSIEAWFGTSTEISDIVEAGETIRRANELLETRVQERTFELEEANSELRAFAHSVAHDLRAPLRNIQGYASAILEDERERLSEEGALYARRMAESAVRLDGLIQDLLEYSRLSRAEIRLERVELASFVPQVLADLAGEIATRQARVKVADGLPAVLAHRATLGQVLANVIGNALKFVAPGVKPVVSVAAERDGARVCLVVADNGIGIAREHQERIFRVFERLHGSETYPGTGIGLAIVRRGLERMGGTVRVDSAPGKGSRFNLELRAAPRVV